jgi:hypothetical protein
VLTRGLPECASYDLVYRHCLDIDETGDRLAFGSTTGHVWTTGNGGDDWRRVDALLPPAFAVRFG